MVDKYIKELLFDHDCVIIPEFGGFITHRLQADIHPITHKFNPPSRKIAFNQQLKRNDGLLISYLSSEEGLTAERASALVKDFIDSVLVELKKYNVYIFKDVGRLFYNPENNLEFEPENKINYLDDSFGLSELFFKPIERDYNVMTKVPARVSKPASKNKPEKVKVVKEVKLDEDGNPIKPKRKNLTVALLVLPFLITGLCIAYIYQNNKNPESVSTAGIVSSERPADTITGSEQLSSAEAPVDAADTVVEFDAPEFIAPGLSPEAATPAPEPKAVPEENVLKKKRKEKLTPEVSSAISSSQGRYFVVVGSFANKKNAFRLKNKISNAGANATVISPSGNSQFYKVSVADFDDKAEAIKKMEESRSDFGNSIWVLSY